jgi:tripartite-type tricarboxylate transporter receptor subunit TctC
MCLKRLLVVLTGTLLPVLAAAQQYPTQPVRIVLPYSAGTGIDSVTRLAADKLRVRLGQPVIVENKVGAAGNIGTEAVVKAPPDGHTVLVVANTLTMNPSLYHLPFDTQKDLQPVGLFAKGGLVLVVGANSARTLNDFVALAKAQPGKLNYASSGVGTPLHLAMELFKRTVGVDMVHVPHKGMAEAMTNLVAGHVDAMFAPVQTALPHIRSNRLRALAVAGPVRYAVLGDVPTVAESLKLPAFAVELWYGVFVPSATPKAIAERLNRELREVLDQPDMQATLAAQAMATSPGSPEALAALVRADMNTWSRVIREAGIKAE